MDRSSEEIRKKFKQFFRLVTVIFVGVSIVSCKQNKQEPQERTVIDITRYKSDGDPVGTHRSAEGVLFDDHDIFAPREGESIEEYRERTGNDNSASSNPYDEGYEDGYEEGYEAGRQEAK